MWDYEHCAETSAAPEAVWRRWADVATWPEWNADIEEVRLDGPFAAGSVITMTPKGQDPVVLRIVEAVPIVESVPAGAGATASFTDEADFGGTLIRTQHRVERLGDGRSRIVYRTEITGPEADTLGPEIGPAITADFPETIAALVRAALG